MLNHKFRSILLFFAFFLCFCACDQLENGSTTSSPASSPIFPTKTLAPVIQLPVATISPTTFPIPTNELLPTAFKPVLKGTSIPNINSEITDTNASLVQQIARWGTDATQGNDIAFSPDGNYLLVGAQLNAAQIFEISSGKAVGNLFDPDLSPTNRSSSTVIGVSPDGQYAVTVMTPYALLWNLETRELIPASGVGKQFSVDAKKIIFAPDGFIVAVIGKNGFGDENINIFIGPELISRTLRDHNNIVSDISFSPDGQYLVSGDVEGTIHFWDTMTWNNVFTFSVEYPVSFLEFSSTGKTLAIVNGTSINFIDLARLEIVAHFESPDLITAMATSPTSSVFAIGSANKSIYLIDGENGNLLTELIGHTGEPFKITFSYDGKLIASQGQEGTVRLWGILTGDNLAVSTSIDNYTNLATLTPTPISQISPPPILSWPFAPLTEFDIREVRDCEVERFALQRYPSNLSIFEMEGHFTPLSTCDWATLAMAFVLRLDEDEIIPEAGRFAFAHAVSRNPAF